MGIIHKLDPHLVNQIAAGEVIERPASVVKELLENAIDAEASQLVLAVEEGGRKLIRLEDNGLGMDEADLALAVSSHATSKLSTSDDLDRIATFGFRGEALSSIASVSQMSITTRRADAVGGHGMAIDGGQAEAIRDAGGAPGTTIEVRNLFFNIPARRKFLKTEATELGHIVNAVANVALAFPQVAIRLTHNGRLVHDLPKAKTIRERVAAFFGRDLAEKLIEVRSESAAGTIWGLVAPPSETRASTKMQYLYVNGRYVRDRTLFHAIREAYRGLMEANRQPVVFLYLTVPPDEVDVNVHPTKIEVRLRAGQQFYREVLAALRDRFLTTDLAPRLEMSLESAAPLPRGSAAPTVLDVDATEREAKVRQSMADFLRSPNAAPQSRFTYQPGDRRAAAPRREETTAQGQDAPATHPRLHRGATGEAAPASRAIQLHNTYLVAETDEGMLIVDQHALHERVLYEELRERLAGGALESQRLLIASVMDITSRERAFLEEHRLHLARLGVEFEWFGSDSIGIQSFPSMLGNRTPPERVMRDLLDWAAEHGGQPSVEDVLDELLHRMACRAAVKAGEALSPEEIASLLSRRRLGEPTATCPHGRPTTLVLTRDEIERQFKRDYRSLRPKDDETIPF